VRSWTRWCAALFPGAGRGACGGSGCPDRGERGPPLASRTGIAAGFSACSLGGGRQSWCISGTPITVRRHRTGLRVLLACPGTGMCRRLWEGCGSGRSARPPARVRLGTPRDCSRSKAGLVRLLDSPSSVYGTRSVRSSARLGASALLSRWLWPGSVLVTRTDLNRGLVRSPQLATRGASGRFPGSGLPWACRLSPPAMAGCVLLHPQVYGHGGGPRTGCGESAAGGSGRFGAGALKSGTRVPPSRRVATMTRSPVTCVRRDCPAFRRLPGGWGGGRLPSASLRNSRPGVRRVLRLFTGCPREKRGLLPFALYGCWLLPCE